MIMHFSLQETLLMLYDGDVSMDLSFQPPDERERHVVEFLGDRIIVCGGGSSWVGPFENSCYQLSPQCSGWLPDSRVARFQGASSSIGGVMYSLGGYMYPEPEELESDDSKSLMLLKSTGQRQLCRCQMVGMDTVL
jgi:hypothetical protein